MTDTYVFIAAVRIRVKATSAAGRRTGSALRVDRAAPAAKLAELFPKRLDLPRDVHSAPLIARALSGPSLSRGREPGADVLVARARLGHRSAIGRTHDISALDLVRRSTGFHGYHVPRVPDDERQGPDVSRLTDRRPRVSRLALRRIRADIATVVVRSLRSASRSLSVCGVGR